MYGVEAQIPPWEGAIFFGGGSSGPLWSVRTSHGKRNFRGETSCLCNVLLNMKCACTWFHVWLSDFLCFLYQQQALLGNYDTLFMTLPHEHIREFHKQWYLLTDCALEIFLSTGKTCLLAFSQNKVSWIHQIKCWQDELSFNVMIKTFFKNLKTKTRTLSPRSLDWHWDIVTEVSRLTLGHCHQGLKTDTGTLSPRSRDWDWETLPKGTQIHSSFETLVITLLSVNCVLFLVLLYKTNLVIYKKYFY